MDCDFLFPKIFHYDLDKIKVSDESKKLDSLDLSFGINIFCAIN